MKNFAKGRTIYSNYNLKFPHWIVESPEDIEEMHEGVFLGDEIPSVF